MNNSTVTILLVDDEKFVRDLLRTCLEHAQFRVLEAADGAEGLILAREHLPHVIVCDEVMPGLSGMKMLRALRELPETRHIPFVLSTGVAAGVWEAMRTSDERFSILEKPFNPAALLSVVQSFTSGLESPNGQP